MRARIPVPMRALACALVAALASVTAAEDAVVLDNGRRVVGTIVEETDAGIRMDIGSGTLWFTRDRVRSVERDIESGAEDAVDEEASSEAFVMYRGKQRWGTVVVRKSRRDGDFVFDVHMRFFDEEGRPVRQTWITERAGEDLTPRLLQVRSERRDEDPTLVRCTFTDGVVSVAKTVAGETETSEVALPEDVVTPMALNERFVRAGFPDVAMEAPVFDPSLLRCVPGSYVSTGTRPVEIGDEIRAAHVVLRSDGTAVETLWQLDDGTTVYSEVVGVRSIAVDEDVVRALADGDTDRVTGPDSAARTRYADPVAGFAIEKPAPGWTFEEPETPGAGALLGVRNVAMAASVDVLADESPPDDPTRERVASGFKRLLQAHAPDLEVLDEEFTDDEDGGWAYRIEVRATTKGEITRSIGRALVSDGRVFRLIGACPEGMFEVAEPELRAILRSFEPL